MATVLHNMLWTGWWTLQDHREWRQSKKKFKNWSEEEDVYNIQENRGGSTGQRWMEKSGPRHMFHVSNQ